MKKKIIVTAHDFGLCSSVNEGIIYALNHRNNIITELALLPNAPGSSQASAFARRSNASISLCANLTTFKPLTRDPKTLVDESGNFKKVDVATWNFSSFDTMDDEEIKQELDAQWDWFLEHVGRKPSAILFRKNEHGDPKVLLPLCKKAKLEDVAIRSPLWAWRENYGAQSYVEQEGIPKANNVVVCIRDWKGRFGYDLEKDMDTLINDLNQKEGLTELIIFAGFVDEESFKVSTVNWQRGQFLSILEKDDIIQKIKDNFELISYQDL